LSQSQKNCPFLGSKKLKSIKKLKKVQIEKVQKSSNKLKTSSKKLKQAQIRYSTFMVKK